MPKTNLKEQKAQNKPEAAEFLEDGHPNPYFYQKDGEGFEAFQQVLDDKGLWGEYFGKLYRIGPLKSPSDKAPRVCKFASTLTLEKIERQWGGRKYSAWLSRRVGTKDRMVGVFQFDIEAPPIYHDDEAADAGSDAADKTGTGTDPLTIRLLEDLISQRDAAAEDGKQFDMGEALQNALQLQNQGFASALSAITANLGKAEDKTTTLLLTTLLPELLKRRDDPTQQAILTKLIDRALDPPDDTREDPIDRVVKYLDTLERIRPRGGSARGTEWAQVGMTLVQSLPQILQNGTEFLRQAIITKTQLGPVLEQRPALAAAAPQPQPPRNTQAENQQAQAELYARAVIIERIKRAIVELATNQAENPTESGKAAADFADLMDSEFAAALAGAIKNNPASLAQDTILRACATLPHIREFAAGYLAYFEEAETPEPEPAPAAE